MTDHTVTEHDQGCWFARPRDEHGTILPHSDEAKRVSDEYMLHRVADPEHSVGQWFAVRLDDGTSDHVLYQYRRECVRFQRHKSLEYAYFQIQPCGMSVCQAETVLRWHRQHYEATKSLLPDPQERGVIPPLTQQEYLRQCADRALSQPRRPIIIGKRT